jgi:hypothetical protein
VYRLGYGLDRDAVPSKGSGGILSLRHRIQTDSGTHPASCPMGSWGSYPRDKASRHEADHSPPFSAEVKNELDYTAISLIHFRGVVFN